MSSNFDEELDTRALLAIAEAAVDEAEATFSAAVGADPEIIKSPGDFATEADLSVERQLRTLLSHYTGLPVHGEEYGTVLPGEIPGEAPQVRYPTDDMADGLDGPRAASAAEYSEFGGDEPRRTGWWIPSMEPPTMQWEIPLPASCCRSCTAGKPRCP